MIGRAHQAEYGLEGLLVTSTTGFTPGISLVIRVEIRASSWQGSRVRSAVMASCLDTGRSTTGCLGGCCPVIAVQCLTCSPARVYGEGDGVDGRVAAVPAW